MGPSALLPAVGLVFATLAVGCGGVSRVRQTIACKPPWGSPMTLAHPLPCIAKRTTLGRASATAGTRLVLPSTPLVRPSDAGPVWIDGFSRRAGHKTGGVVAITFPAQHVIVQYVRPAFHGDARTHYQAVAQGLHARKVIDLNGRAALVIRWDGSRHNFGSVSFKRNRNEVVVLGQRSETALESLALSTFGRS